MQQLSLWNPEASRLIVHRASRTERLAERLAQELERARPANPLQPQTLIIAHPGLRRWLLGQLARRRSGRGHGIAANLQTLLPWEWLERTARAVLRDQEPLGGDYRREWLRWHVFAALPAIDDAQLLAYLDGEDGERRRFQLAERAAGVFEQYLIYRPEWIAEWEREARPRDWQGRLWRRVRDSIGAPHRAQRRDALLHVLARDGDGEAGPLHVFGVSHLAPDVLGALRALAGKRPVQIYFPDPCREHWVYFRARRAQFRASGPEAAYFEVGHPLLASLGRLAQDFCVALEDADTETERDALDEAEPPHAPQTLLGALQSSVRCAEPALVRGAICDIVENAAAADIAALRDDASLRVHACHTRLREVEVLRDALLGFLADDATLAHSDIVVMAPDIGQYASILPAVFGEPARYDSNPARIPWHLADVTLARTHPLLGACLRLLDLAESRLGVSDVMDLLDVPAVARRFGIDAAARAPLEHAVRRARVAWGLDADMKAQSGAAPVAANSWQFGFDRLYAGFALGDETRCSALDDVLPVNGVSGAVADAVGRLDELLHALRDMRSAFGTQRPLAAWCAWLQRNIDAVLRVDARDEREMTAYAALQRALSGLSEQESAAGRDLPLPWSVAREALRGAFDTITEQQAFLLGGVTFCGLVPQRSIPFRVVCLLGMNEGEFPRAARDSGLNRMHAKPRRGDRDTRHEDRYLFLEALMAARGHLHISYMGEDANSGGVRNPATPLAELLQFLDEQFERGEDDTRPWLVKHPLQPFDARYYQAGERNADPCLFTFSTAFARLPEIGAAEGAPFFSGIGSAAGAGGIASDGDVRLATLRRFWRNPLRAVLRDRAGVSLEALADESWPDREPLEAAFERRELVESRLLFDALECDGEIPAIPPPWLALSGALAAGPAGELAYAHARECAAAALAQARSHLGTNVRVAPVAVNLDLGGGVHLRGALEHVLRLADARLCLFDAKPWRAADFRDLVPFYIDWAALRLTAGDAATAHFVEKDAKSTDAGVPPLLEAMLRQSAAQLRDGLRRLIAASGDARPLLFPPQSAWEWANAEPDKRARKARQAWEGDSWTVRGERRHSPGYPGLLGRDLALFESGSEAHARFVAAVELVSTALDPEHRVLCRAQDAAA